MPFGKLTNETGLDKPLTFKGGFQTADQKTEKEKCLVALCHVVFVFVF